MCSTGCVIEGLDLWNGLEVLDQRERLVEMVQKGAPLLVSIGLSESDRVVVQLLPVNEQ